MFVLAYMILKIAIYILTEESKRSFLKWLYFYILLYFNICWKWTLPAFHVNLSFSIDDTNITIPIIILLFISLLTDTKYWHSVVAEVASYHMESNLIFAVADEVEFAVDLHSLGLGDWGEEVAVGIFAPGPLKYPMKEEFNVVNLKQFVDDFQKNVLVPHYSSEPSPKKGKGPVKTIVGSTFKDIMYSPTEHVVVMLCGPNVKECKQVW